jgi:hypothetical protein
MRLVFLYGPPGVGKLSVGSELAALTGFKLFHNHLTVDLVWSIFPRGSAPWFRLLRQIRRDVFTEATREGFDLVFTGVARATPEYEDVVRTMFEPVWHGGGTLVFVQLACAREELLKRVQNECRRARNKLTDPQRLVDEYDLDVTLPFERHLRVDSTRLSPAETAAHIVAHFDLPLLSEEVRRGVPREASGN